MAVLLRGGRVLDPGNQQDSICDLLIEKGCVAESGDLSQRYEKADPDRLEVVDCKGHWVVPGFIDLHVHFREPGHEYKEDIASGARAATAGGFTTVCPMPNTRPTNDTRAVVELMVARGKAVPGPRIMPFGAITVGLKGEQLTEMADLRDGGAIGVSDDGYCVMNSAVMRRAMEYASTFDMLVSQHCEDHHLTAGAQMHEGRIATEMGLKGWPREAEDVIVARDILLAERIGVRYHVAHISSMNSARMVREAKSRGLRVSAEVTPHHLLLTDESVLGYRTSCKVTPPLREAEDVEAMIAALADGTIDCIATDHAPHSSLEKDCEFAEASPGMVGLETALAALLGLVRAGKLKEQRVIEALTSAPARVGKIDGGSLAVGARADIALIDPMLPWVVNAQTLRGKSDNTPWLGQELRGAVMRTWVAGESVFSRS